MTDEPTPKEIENLFVEETGFATDDFPAAIFDFARAVLAKWGTPAPVGVGEVAERYRNAIASACEGWTMPDGLRKHLETALWSPPTTSPPAAESVGRDAGRIVKWSDRVQRAHPKSEPEFWPDALRVKYMADEISDLRAARAPADSVQEDAALWHWLAEYLVGTRTDLDDEIVASETVNDLRKLVEAAIKQGATQ